MFKVVISKITVFAFIWMLTIGEQSYNIYGLIKFLFK
jgi:hypothetical protein